MKKKLLILLAIVALSISSVALAQENENESESNEAQKTSWQEKRDEMEKKREEIKTEKKAKLEERQNEMKQEKEEKLAERCAKIQEKVQERSGNLDSIKEKHMSVYQNMTDRISKFIERLSGQGYDVSKIQADLVVLKEKIQKFSDDFSAQATKLGETKDLACGHSDGEFKGKLVEARKMMKTVHADAMDIRTYVRTVVRVDIQALRNQKVEDKKLEAEKTTAAESETETENESEE